MYNRNNGLILMVSAAGCISHNDGLPGWGTLDEEDPTNTSSVEAVSEMTITFDNGEVLRIGIPLLKGSFEENGGSFCGGEPCFEALFISPATLNGADKIRKKLGDPAGVSVTLMGPSINPSTWPLNASIPMGEGEIWDMHVWLDSPWAFGELDAFHECSDLTSVPIGSYDGMEGTKVFGHFAGIPLANGCGETSFRGIFSGEFQNDISP